MIEMFLMNGDPKTSTRMMVMKDKNPRPMNSGDPQGSGRGAAMLGQSAKNPVSGLSLQLFDPPPQFAIPDSPISDAPIIRITVPETGLARAQSKR
jgi:hypothetical protein